MRRLPALAAALALAAAAPPPAQWREDASRLKYDRSLGLNWRHNLGDWVDAAGVAQGDRPFLTKRVGRAREGGSIELDVTDYVRRHGADFRFTSVGGGVGVASREADAARPALAITRGGVTRALEAAADTTLDRSTYKSLGRGKRLRAAGAFLLRFDQGPDSAIERAVLTLGAVNITGAPTLALFRPVTSVGAPAFAAALAPPPRTGPARVLAQWTGADWRGGARHTVADGVVTAFIEGDRLTAFDRSFKVPGAPTEAYLTVVIRLGDDWTDRGGKLPGLANTGRDGGECFVAGVKVGRGGWGGRPANGCRWSARTGFRKGGRPGAKGLSTYFYALEPHNLHGVMLPWTLPAPKGRWFAYVQRVRLNTPGQNDGALGYWLVADGPARGGRPVQARSGIRWRDTAAPPSAINEVWANVYCGGTNCGPKPWPRSTVSLRRLTVTDALPDLAAVQAEVDRLNRRA